MSAFDFNELFVFLLNIYMGRPMPRPGACGSPPDFGLLMVSSTDKIMQVASQAACKALILMTDGSQTQASKLSAMVSLPMSTPYQQLPGMEKEERRFFSEKKSNI